MRSIPVKLDPALLIAAPVLLLTFPLRWSAAFALAALIHESAHILSVLALGGEIHAIRIGFSGAEIHAHLLSPFGQFFSIFSGPAASLLLSLYTGPFVELAVWGFIHGVFNLLPVLPLDGGQLIHLFLTSFVPNASAAILRWIRIVVYSLLSLAGIVAAAGKIPLVPGIVILILFSLIRKSPCKPNGIKVQ